MLTVTAVVDERPDARRPLAKATQIARGCTISSSSTPLTPPSSSTSIAPSALEDVCADVDVCSSVRGPALGMVTVPGSFPVPRNLHFNIDNDMNVEETGLEDSDSVPGLFFEWEIDDIIAL
ncbi:hypothetical protein BD410DRAFT_313181 [Rickenella mellea]|uniref:Uncharacterized protein n=1 Tax=Rickenella mellea TaxID=50990 RepID=A0A4Y7PF87_9AGAM|nr:hypothetical protein BD410DRAFT_313181 [Rickenella mellea]